MIANPLWGSLLDYVGLRAGMLAAVDILDNCQRIARLGNGSSGFCVRSRLLGFSKGATFPGGLRTAADSLPLDRQSRGMGISYSGASLGAIFAPLIITPIALRFGWRAAFIATGALGAGWLAVWWFVARPPLVGAVNRSKRKVAWPNLFERRFWLLVVGMGLGKAQRSVLRSISALFT